MRVTSGQNWNEAKETQWRKLERVKYVRNGSYYRFISWVMVLIQFLEHKQ